MSHSVDNDVAIVVLRLIVQGIDETRVGVSVSIETNNITRISECWMAVKRGSIYMWNVSTGNLKLFFP